MSTTKIKTCDICGCRMYINTIKVDKLLTVQYGKEIRLGNAIKFLKAAPEKPDNPYESNNTDVFANGILDVCNHCMEAMRGGLLPRISVKNDMYDRPN